MITKYNHVQKAFVDIECLKWSRIPVQGVDHKHAFVRDGEEKRTTSVEVCSSTREKFFECLKHGRLMAAKEKTA